MGFPRNRAEKAVAVTGNRGVQIASDWLLSHVNDPKLDDPEPQEFIIYLCPVGEFLVNLLEYWDHTLQLCGWNSAHIYQPHITLCSFFKIPHSRVSVIDQVVARIALELKEWPALGSLGLHLFTQSQNFIGYFVKSPYHEFIEKLMITVQQEFLKAGIEMKPQMKQLHMTLAFQYEASSHDLLMKLAEEIKIPSLTHWQIKVFSRNSELKLAEVRRVIKMYKPQQEDELELVDEDCVYMEPEEHERSPDGWFKGTSWRTGVSGFFPGNFTIKCSQMDTWALHREVSLPNFSPSNVNVNVAERAIESRMLMDIGDYDNLWAASVNGNTADEELYAKVTKKPQKLRPAEPRKLFVVRHAERCDFAFSKSWFEKCFDETGKYFRFNLNCPKTMVQRNNYKDFIRDCPLTVIGREQAKVTGEALREAGESISYIYCSPSLRCVETATELMSAYGSPLKMCVEPCLFEWLGWHKPLLPTFMSYDELERCGFPIDTSYIPLISFDSIPMSESVGDYYRRSYNFTQHVLKKHKAGGGNILIVAHSGSLDACTRQLQGKAVRNPEQFRNIVRGCPYCCVCMAVEDVMNCRWNLVEPSIAQFSHGANKDFKWDTLLTT
ncbi:ecdysteroid-phosphate phosphatase-like isoform X2 [Physella acuta]|nr:ecdysteroid-phosphate phosphatase-like isoform X2 [Physella acuta]